MANSSSASRQGAAKSSLLGRIGAGITYLRNFVLNSLFILLMLIVCISLLQTCSGITVPKDSALVINPNGIIVEARSYVDPLEELLAAGRAQQEIELAEILTAIKSAGEDEHIRMIALNLDRLGGVAPAHAHRIGQALDSFSKRGKKVVAYGRFFSQSQYHIASFADALYMHPMGQVLLEGFGGYNFYFKELLENFDVNVHVFRVGEFKSAIEPMTRNDMSEESRMAGEALYQNLWQNMLADISRNRQVDHDTLQNYADDLAGQLAITQGDLARAALENNLVDELLSGDQAEVRIADDVGYHRDGSGNINGIDFLNYIEARGLMPAPLEVGPDKIAVIVAEGIIVTEGRGQGLVAADTLIPLIRQAREDDSIKALVLRVNSPGGSQLASELIRQELELVQLSGKPVVASFGASAASGGYWISATADGILAEPTSITGSIGIFSFIPTFEETLARYGVHTDGVGTTTLTLGTSPFTGLNDPMQQILQARVEHGYEQFINLVARGREMELDDVEEIAQGRIWSGAVAHELGLIDELGGLDSALSHAAELAGLTRWSLLPLREAIDPRSLLLQQLVAPAARHLMPASAHSGAALTYHLRYVSEMLEGFDDPFGVYALCAQCIDLPGGYRR